MTSRDIRRFSKSLVSFWRSTKTVWCGRCNLGKLELSVFTLRFQSFSNKSINKVEKSVKEYVLCCDLRYFSPSLEIRPIHTATAQVQSPGLGRGRMCVKPTAHWKTRQDGMRRDGLVAS